MTAKHQIQTVCEIDLLRPNQTPSFVVETCYTCGGPVAMTPTKYRRAREHGETYYCADGHSTHYTESEVTRLRNRLSRAEEEANASAQKARDMESLYEVERKAHVKAKQRIHRGVCPHCNRTFQNVSRHMEAKHKDKVRR